MSAANDKVQSAILQSQRDQEWMRRAIDMGRRNPRAPFGTVIVHSATGDVWAEGVNRGQENPTWHGEIDALNQLAVHHPSSADDGAGDWSDLHLYTTAEPCCMCQAAILWSGLGRVVYGTSIETLQRLGWNQIDLRAAEVIRRTPFASCQLTGGVLEAECDALFQDAAGR